MMNKHWEFLHFKNMKTNSDWNSPEQAINYLSRADKIPHRTGNGRLLDLCLLKCKNAFGTALDFSQTMLESLYDKYSNNEKINIVEHDLNNPLQFEAETFDAVVSSFAIHHVSDDRKHALYREVWKIIQKGGVFCNLEHVSSPTENLHKIFFEKLGVEEDSSNLILDVETQLKWLNEIGFEDVDCYWKWRELALIIGKKPL